MCDWRNATLRKLDLSNNYLNDGDILKLANALEENSHLKWLSLSYNKLGPKSGSYLGSALALNTALEHLNISWNEMLTKGTNEIVLGLKENRSLKVLDLSWCGLADDGTNALKELLESNQSLTFLDITNNSIGPRGAKNIAEGIEGNTSLKILKVGKNRFLSPSTEALLQAISVNQESNLSELYLENIPQDHGCKKILDDILERRPWFLCSSDIFIQGGRLSLNKVKPPTPLETFVDLVEERYRNKYLKEFPRTIRKQEVNLNFLKQLKMRPNLPTMSKI